MLRKLWKSYLLPEKTGRMNFTKLLIKFIRVPVIKKSSITFAKLRCHWSVINEYDAFN